MTAKWKTQNSRNPHQRRVPKKPANEFIKYGLTWKMLNRGNAYAPTVLCIGSPKAKFTFEYQLSQDAGKAERSAALLSASMKASEFAKAYALFESVYANVPWEYQHPLLIGRADSHRAIPGGIFTQEIIKEPSGWELHGEPSKEYIAHKTRSWALLAATKNPETRPIEKSLLDCVSAWAEKQSRFFKDSTLVGLGAALQDPIKFVLNTEADISSHSDLATAFDGVCEGKKTGIRVLVDGYCAAPGSIVGTMRAYDLDAENGESQGLSVLSGFVIGSNDGNPFLQVHHERAQFMIRAYAPSWLTFKPEDLGMTTETVSLHFSLNMPIATGMPRFKQVATESYDMDFSMDDQVSSSGLSR